MPGKCLIRQGESIVCKKAAVSSVTFGPFWINNKTRVAIETSKIPICEDHYAELMGTTIETDFKMVE